MNRSQPPTAACREMIRIMKQALIRYSRATALSAALCLGLAACAATPTESEPAQEAVKTYEFEPWEGDGMEIGFDHEADRERGCLITDAGIVVVSK